MSSLMGRRSLINRGKTELTNGSILSYQHYLLGKDGVRKLVVNAKIL